ncbi:hypothetical protein PHJA_001569500 [Phtheirospermum japonicum]|uniref:Uncharacterized protein n=1 Tax=Phtheirospermum japonicum TaxID=374723 RepID=A0A830C3P1_9LAMI|nr:hypothetical protein PHJA_001569500 [Phtheirospermum japonicum]
MDRRSEDNNKKSIGTSRGEDKADPESYCREAMEYASNPDPEKVDVDNEYDDSEWEDGSIPTLSSINDFREDLVDGVSVEFDVSHGVAKRKLVRRATAEEKEVAEFVHKAHLLCLLGRGRIIDSACNHPLIQVVVLLQNYKYDFGLGNEGGFLFVNLAGLISAFVHLMDCIVPQYYLAAAGVVYWSLVSGWRDYWLDVHASILSLVPAHLLKIAEFSNLTANNLSPLVSWFHKIFHVRSSTVAEKSCHSALASTLETQEGTPEAVWFYP